MGFTEESKKKQMSTFYELYFIRCGNVYSYYTSGTEEVVFELNTYKPRPIKRGELTHSTKLNALRLQITAPIDDTLKKYIANSPSEPVIIKIIRLFTSGEFLVVFEGDVIDVTFSNEVANCTCESRTGVFRNKIPKMVFQAVCNNSVFDDVCALSEQGYAIVAIVSISGSTLISPIFATFSDGYFDGGRVEYDTDIRLITKHIGNTVTLQVPFDSRVKDGSSVVLYPGCDKRPATCKNKFNNFANFVGFPYIPSSNITLWGIK